MHAETTLWLAVTHRAFLDATQSVKRLRPGQERRRAIAERNQARAWLAGAGADFVEVCTLADLDPGAVRALACAVANNGWRLLDSMADAFDVVDWSSTRDWTDQRLMIDDDCIHF
jgi:hypothetical protein